MKKNRLTIRFVTLCLAGSLMFLSCSSPQPPGSPAPVSTPETFSSPTPAPTPEITSTPEATPVPGNTPKTKLSASPAAVPGFLGIVEGDEPSDQGVGLHSTGGGHYQMGTRTGRYWVWLSTGTELELSLRKVSEKPEGFPEVSTGTGTYSETFAMDVMEALEKHPGFREPVERTISVYLAGPIHKSVNQEPRLVKKMKTLRAKLRN